MNFADIPWSQLRERHESGLQQLMSSSLDVTGRNKLQKDVSRLGKLLSAYDTWSYRQVELVDLEKQRDAAEDDEMRALFSEELESVKSASREAEAALDLLLYPPSEVDDRSVFLEIRAGAGGQEASLFVSDLARMYMLYAQKKGWQASIVSASDTDLGGYREIVLSIEGKYVYGHLKKESGVHRVQRVPKTETAGRVHTSTVTVAVLPEIEEVELSINPADLRIDTYRAGGAGGQHVNKTDSAVRITHIPTGVVVACQDERSQHKNKAKAMKVLQSRLFAAQEEKRTAELSQQRKEQMGTGERAEKVRTYNYPQNRITDHQVEVTLKKLDMVMEGDLDEIIEPLIQKEREDRRKQQSSVLL
jgi:peptide chain release factor 1